MDPYEYPRPADSYRYRPSGRRALLAENERRTPAAEVIAGLRIKDPREVTLAFVHHREQKSYTCQLVFTDRPDDSWTAYCVRESQITAPLRDLRTAWDEAIRAQGWETRLDLKGPDEARWAPVFEQLEKAGQAAFEAIFLNHEDVVPMNELTAELCARLRAKPCVIGIWSDDLFAPWGLLCLPPPTEDEAGLTGGPEGSADAAALTDCEVCDAAEYADGRTLAEIWGPRFLGYRHLIEHRGRQRHADCAGPLIELRGRARPGTLSLVLTDPPRGHGTVADLLTRHTDQLDCASRTNRFLAALHADRFDRQIIYVCCHGQGYSQDPARLYASTVVTESITVGDVLSAVAGGNRSRARRHGCGVTHLHGGPLLYMSVCRAGDYTPASGEPVSRTLAELGTSCLVAPEVITPKVLAVEHAKRFFGPFLDGVEAGRQLRAITQDLAREYGTLLGLIYAVKGRQDARLQQAVAS
ncbi:hypothetical protein AB0J38_03565 [Streptomyces sp. NPDC050095]|uniref:hypothetical protein n=1 Tax=unclassified Streptomyces TaxID=2593676 RepID=UPI003415F651